MTTTTNFHHVKSMKVEQRPLSGGHYGWVTELIATNEDGSTFTLTLFHAEPMPIEGAEFINFVAQPEEA